MVFFLAQGQVPRDDLPPAWDAEVVQTALRYGRMSTMDGVSSTSINEGTKTTVIVLDGVEIADKIPWLRAAYLASFLQFAETLSKQKLFPSTDIKSSINVNVIRGIGGSYERHVDTNPVTAILYANELGQEEGGLLIFETVPREVVRPTRGLFVAFDARETIHYVSPLRVNTIRISVPMNYYNDPFVQWRPADLDTYLYGPRDVRA